VRPRRFLLLSTALSSATIVSACKKDTIEPPPGNPKGAIYDAGEPLPPPGNPKGAAYDASSEPPKPLVSDAGGDTSTDGGKSTDGKTADGKSPTDAGTTSTKKRDAGVPVRHPLPGNPKGSHYHDNGGGNPFDD
jgi:hypothetical protein